MHEAEMAVPPGRPMAGDVVAPLSYVLPGREVPVSYAFDPPPGLPWETGEFADIPVRIEDARARDVTPRIHADGFELVAAPTEVRSFDDRAEIESLYYREVLGIALGVTGGACGFVFDHLVRRRDPAQKVLGFGRKVQGQPPSANGRIHNDYTEASGQRRLKLVLGDRAQGVRRFCIVNVWRPIAHPVVDAPLALCDARTVMAGDPVVAQVRYRDRVGEIYLLRHSPTHRWHYFPDMRRDEAVVFKQYDSQLGGVSRFTPHSAFDNPRAPAGTPPRQSIEARVLVLFDQVRPR